MKILKMLFTLTLFTVSIINVNAQRGETSFQLVPEGGCMETQDCGFEMCITPTEETDCFLVEVFIDSVMPVTPYIAADNGFYQEYSGGSTHPSAIVCFEPDQRESAIIACGFVGYCRDGCIVIVGGG